MSEFNSEIEGSFGFCCVLCVLEVVCMWSVSCLWDVVYICVEDGENGVCSVYVWWRLNVLESSLGCL